MPVQSQSDQWKVAEHHVTLRDLRPSYGWPDAWFAMVFLLSRPVRESRQEAAALRKFARWERRRGEQPQTARGSS